MRAFVTGGTGFLGSHVCRRLLEEGHEVRALVRESSDLALLEDLDVATHVGDVTDPGSLRAGMDGCDAVFHLAGFVSYWDGHADLLHEVNVEGTYNVVEAAKATDGVHRLVHTSSVAALGIPDDPPGDEDTTFDWDEHGIDYMMTKHRGQRIALGASRHGLLDVVVVNPATVLGPGDKNLNGGQFVRAVVKGDVPGAPKGAVNMVDVRDVADGHLRAYEDGASGEAYVLGSENLRWIEFFDLVAEVTGADPPSWEVPYPAALALGAVNDLVARFTGEPPMLTRNAVRAAYQPLAFSSGKARKELGYDPRPIRASVRDTYDWYVDHGYLRPVEDA